MDWSHHSAANRKANKMYEDSHVTSWGLVTTTENNQVTSEKLVSTGFEEGLEKARYIDCKNSNKYNITQSIAEAFEVFCQYEYKCDIRGRFIKNYIENNKVWTGRKVIFYNRAIKSDKPVTIEYTRNLNTISRVKDSSEVYTKMYVTPIESSTMDTGYISIADTSLNPTLDDFILNFDYLYQTNAISQYQLNFVKTYEVETYKINQNLINLAPNIEDLTIRVNNLKSSLTQAENERSASQKQLEEYQALRDSAVKNTPIHKNKDNSFSIIFVEDGNKKKASFRLEGIVSTSIKGYADYTYSDKIFDFSTGESAVIVNQEGPVGEDDTNFYLLLNDYGFPSSIYTSKNNSKFKIKNSAVIYLDLTYNPRNEYEAICQQLIWRIDNKTVAITGLENSINNLQTELDELLEQQNEYLKQKEILNQKLETTLGPALREGYWTPDTYEDPGESKIVESIQRSNNVENGVTLKFDTIPFEGEHLNYYYAKEEDLTNDVKTYYPYIDLSNYYSNWENKNIENFTLHLLDPFTEYSYKVPATMTRGNYYIIYNTNKYYYTLPQIRTNNNLKLTVNENGIPCILIVETNNTYVGSLTELTNATNITHYFGGTDLYQGERLLYPEAGFIFGFIKANNVIKPVLILNNININYNLYNIIKYSFSSSDQGFLKNRGTASPIITGSSELCYPRIIIYDSNVNYKSDKLNLIPYKTEFTPETQKIENYKDYNILIRNSKPHFNLKITQRNNLSTILNWHYRIEYRISRANEMLYLDAKNVARDNAYPKYSYDLKVANTPNEIGFYELGQLVYVNDYSVGIHAASGYVSGITLHLDNIQDDEVEIKNYKTKFEDLFSTITASSEAMRNNQVAYNIAANGFNSDGTIEGSVLQNSILNNNISMNYSNTNVEIDDVNGIVLTNQQPYLNGVYGQVKLMGGGIFLSNAIDAGGSRIWNTGITPNGINAAMITTGQLDVNKIRVFAGNNVAFQWNSEGIFAYKQNEGTGSVDLNNYVRYSNQGLQFVSGEHTAVDLGWNGLLISTQNGSTELTGDLGLTVYYGQKNSDSSNYAIRIGKFIEDNQYGMRLYKEMLNQDNKTYSYIPTLITTNNGELWLRDYISVGLENWTEDGVIHAAGISGNIDNTEAPSESVRFWAGSSYLLRKYAPFRVLQDGTLWATQANIEGNITATNIIANKGQIGGWDINENSLSSDGIVLQAKSEDQNAAIIVGDSSQGNFVTITSDGTLTANGAVINGTINASGGTIGGLTVEDLSNINANLKNESVEITSSKGYVTKTGEEFNTTFTAIIKKGGIEISEEEYTNYSFNWLCRDSEEEDWRKLPDSETNNRFVSYSEIHFTQRQVKCEVTNLKGE